MQETLKILTQSCPLTDFLFHIVTPWEEVVRGDAMLLHSKNKHCQNKTYSGNPVNVYDCPSADYS